MRHRTGRGHTLIEMLVLSLVVLLIGGAVAKLMAASYESQYQITNQNGAQTTAREAVDTIVDGVRGAANLAAADASGLTWTDNSGRKIRYWLVGTDLRRSVNGSPGAGQVVLAGIQRMTFSYGLWTGTAWTFTSAPSSAAAVGAVTITITGSRHEQTRAITGSTRIRQQRRTISGTTKTF